MDVRTRQRIVVLGASQLEVLGARAVVAQDPGLELLSEEIEIGTVLTGGAPNAADIVVFPIQGQEAGNVEDGDTCTRLLEVLPNAAIIALIDEASQTLPLLQAGAMAIVLKSAILADLREAIQSIGRGEPFLSRTLLRSVIAPVQGRETRTDVPMAINRTKLHRPPPPIDAVERMRLINVLNDARDLPLILISAPAGFGKSVLLSAWIQGLDHTSAWFTLEKDESDLRRFLVYLLGAVRAADRRLGNRSAELLGAAQLPVVTTIVATLREDFDQIDSPVFLVLDDYHTLNAGSPVHEFLNQLLAHPPIDLHIIIVTRRDPPLSLVILRGKGQIAELRTRDLAFEDEEAGRLIEQISGSTIDRDTLEKLQSSLEGWPAGIRLAGLAIRQTDRTDRSVSLISGATRQATDYLAVEVVEQLPDPLRFWLCRTSLLERLCPSLCEMVCGPTLDETGSTFDGREFLRQLQDEGLFVIPLDAEGQWFRYHPVFQDALRRRLDTLLSPAEVARLNLLASNWFEEHGEIESAIDQALRGGSDAAAVEIVERHYREALNRERWHTVDQWLGILGRSALASSPELLVAYGWVAANGRDVGALQWMIETFESLDVKNLEERLGRDLDCFRGYVRYASGDIANAIGFLAGSVSNLPRHTTAPDGLTATLYGVLLTMNGELQKAIVLLDQLSQSSAADEGFCSQSIIGLMIVHTFAANYRQTITESHRLSIDRIELQARKANLLGCALFEAGEFPAAASQLTFAIRHRYLLPSLPAYECMAALALTQFLLGNASQAMTTVDELVAFVHERGGVQGSKLAASCRARLALMSGDRQAAESWILGSEVAINAGEFLVSIEIPAFTLVRILVAGGSPDDLNRAESALSAINGIAESLHLTCHKIDVLILQANLQVQREQVTEAGKTLFKALALASGGALRPFVELPESTADLLTQFSAEPDYRVKVNQIMAARKKYSAAVRPGRRLQTDSLPVSLTNRELDILELLSRRLQNKEIASNLFVSVETVKTHLKHLYSKIGVRNRREAAAVAEKFLRL